MEEGEVVAAEMSHTNFVESNTSTWRGSASDAKMSRGRRDTNDFLSFRAIPGAFFMKENALVWLSITVLLVHFIF